MAFWIDKLRAGPERFLAQKVECLGWLRVSTGQVTPTGTNSQRVQSKKSYELGHRKPGERLGKKDRNKEERARTEGIPCWRERGGEGGATERMRVQKQK
jgi:hypothetical protein